MQPKSNGLALSNDIKYNNTGLIEDYFRQGDDMQKKIKADN